MSRICFLTLSFSLVSSAALAQAPPEVTANAILGIEIGMPIERVREIVADFGTPDSRPTRDGGTKEVWRLTRTGFAWLAMKANRDGRLVWLTGHRRSGQEVPLTRSAHRLLRQLTTQASGTARASPGRCS